ncbi:MAG: LemA family protein [archaeon]
MAWLMFSLIGLIVLVVLVFLYYFNRFILLGNRIDNSLSQIDVQLKRRADLIPNLIETVKGFAKHEKAAISAVTEARKAMMSAKDLPSRIKANVGLESALKTIFALAEGYPDLKANTNFLELQKELASTEDRVAYSRQYYNDSILRYNDLCKAMPGLFFARLYGKQPREYLKIAEAERKLVKVDF